MSHTYQPEDDPDEPNGQPSKESVVTGLSALVIIFGYIILGSLLTRVGYHLEDFEFWFGAIIVFVLQAGAYKIGFSSRD